MDYQKKYAEYKMKYFELKHQHEYHQHEYREQDNYQLGGNPNKNKLLIQVKGIPGSGKSYICSLLPKNIKCLDTDDFITSAYDELVKTKKKVSWNSITKLAYMNLCETIKKYEYVCVVGILLNMYKANKKYFIKLIDNQLDEIYKRTILREINKYKQVTTPNVLNKIKSLKTNEISNFLSFKYHINAIEPVYMTFDVYKRMYKDALAFEQKNKLDIKTQKEIVEDIKKLVALCEK